MGGSSSKVTTQVTNKALTNFMMETGKECGAGSANVYKLKFGEVGGDFVLKNSTFKQEAVVNFKCMQESMSEAELKQKLATSLAQQSQSEANPLALPWSGADSQANAKIYNEVVTNLNMKDVQKCASTASNFMEHGAQKVGGNVIIDNVKVEQVATVISTCDQMSKLSQQLTTAINNKIDQTASSRQMGFLEGLIGDYKTMAIVAVVLIIVLAIIGGLTWYFLKNKKGTEFGSEIGADTDYGAYDFGETTA